ncbi:Zinc finger protein BALDIBIS [Dirofilaria immitis]
MIYNETNKTVISINQWICQTMNGTLNEPNILIGTTYLTLSLIFQIAYLPCLITFLRREHRCHSCFKLMIVIASWFAHSALCIILNFNRCCNLYYQRTLTIFTKWRLWFLVCLALLYAFTMRLLSPKAFYHSNLGIWLNHLDPLAESRKNWFHTFNNVCVVVITVGQYIFIAMVLRRRSHVISDKSKITNPQLFILVQSIIISFLLITCSVLYIIIDFVFIPPTFLPYIHISWMFLQGGKGFLYIAMNSNVQRNIRNIICKQK